MVMVSKKKVFITMISLKSNFRTLIVLSIVINFFSCVGKMKRQNTESGFLGSPAYQNELDNNKDNKGNYEYSIKRMFLLLGEESFLYNSDYNVYAVYFFVEKGITEFYVIKDKDSFLLSDFKRLGPNESIFYIDKDNSDKNVYRKISMEVKSQLLNRKTLPLINDKFKKIAFSANLNKKYIPGYHKPARGLFLYFENKYYLISDFNIEPNVMNEVDSFFRISLTEQ